MSYNKSYRKKVFGFSLVEVTIVLALSLVLVGMVSGVYSLRRNTASDVAVKQIVSEIQTVRNDAQKGLGPTDAEKPKINSGESLYGQTIGFNNTGCSSGKSCINVFKTVLETNGTTVRGYGSYQINLPENMAFNLINNGDAGNCEIYLSCYKIPGNQNYQTLGDNPIDSDGGPVGIAVLNGSGAMYAFNGVTNHNPALEKANYTGERQGKLSLQVASFPNRGDISNASAWVNVTPKYFITIDLSGSNTITVDRK